MVCHNLSDSAHQCAVQLGSPKQKSICCYAASTTCRRAGPRDRPSPRRRRGIARLTGGRIFNHAATLAHASAPWSWRGRMCGLERPAASSAALSCFALHSLHCGAAASQRAQRKPFFAMPLQCSAVQCSGRTFSTHLLPGRLAGRRGGRGGRRIGRGHPERSLLAAHDLSRRRRQTEQSRPSATNCCGRRCSTAAGWAGRPAHRWGVAHMLCWIEWVQQASLFDELEAAIGMLRCPGSRALSEV
jgi:hypothetical protein